MQPNNPYQPQPQKPFSPELPTTPEPDNSLPPSQNTQPYSPVAGTNPQPQTQFTQPPTSNPWQNNPTTTVNPPAAPQNILPPEPINYSSPYAPVQPTENQPYFSQPSIPPSSQKNKLKLLFVLVAGLVVIGTSGVFAYSSFIAPTPDKAFKNALENALSTKQFTQKLADRMNNATILHDVSNVKDPRVSTKASIGLFGPQKIELEGYGSFKNSYVRFSGSDNPEFINTSDGAWAQVRNNYVLPDDANLLAFNQVYDPNYTFFGPFIFGNFANNDRETLLRYILDQKVYTYDETKVTVSKLGDIEVYIYPLVIEQDKLKELYKKVAEIVGVDTARITSTLSSVTAIKTASLYISKQNSQLLKFNVEDRGISSEYSDIDTTKLPAEPEAKILWKEYSAMLRDRSPINSLDTVQSKSQDTERQTDIKTLATHLEISYNNNAWYPTLKEINDSTWRAANMRGLDQAALRDPDGTSSLLNVAPTPGKYSYQPFAADRNSACDNKATKCVHFTLTAVLGTGSQYIKGSLN